MKNLIELIGRAEASGDPDAVYSGIPRELRPEKALGKPLTECLVSEIITWQQSIRPKVASTAVGLPQVIYKTLNGLADQGEIAGKTVFDEDAQKSVIMALLQRRGLEECASGKMSVQDFALNLAKEWASMPVPRDIERNGRTIKEGCSYYSGDGLNKSLVSPDQVLDAIRADLGFDTADKASAKASVRPTDSPPVHREAETDLDTNKDFFKELWDRNREHAIKLVKQELKIKGSRTVRDAGNANKVAGTAAGGGILVWMANLLPDNSRLQPYIETVQNHLPLALAIAAVAVFLLVSRIVAHRVDDAIRKGR